MMRNMRRNMRTTLTTLVSIAIVGTAMVVPVGGASAATVASDSFGRADGLLGTADSGQTWKVFDQTCGGCTPRFLVDNHRARIDPASRVPTVGHAVIDTNLTSNYRVEADITLSPTYRRANTGLSALFRNASNHLFCKIEVTAGNPSGLLTIGETQGGAITSLLAAKYSIGLSNGNTYHLAIDVPSDPRSTPVTCTVSGSGGTIASASYRLRQSDYNAYGSGDKQGLRTKVEFDEDDTRSTWDNFRVTSNATNPPPPPPTSGCTVAWSGSNATISWAPTGGTDVIRRNGVWLATPPAGTSSYVDTSAPAGAIYLVRAWVGGTRVDTTCTDGSGSTTTTTPTTTTPTTQPPTTTTVPSDGCQATRTGNSTTVLTWVDGGGTHVVRRNGSWLATPGSGVATYTDNSSPAGATYELRSWVNGNRIDTPCV